MKERENAHAIVNIFYVYASEDEELLDKLLKHLSVLRATKIINDWCDREIVPGDNRSRSINEHFSSASVILLLISPDFFSSKTCLSQMYDALERSQSGKAVVVPVILRPVDWEVCTDLAPLQCLPSRGKPISEWASQDEAYQNVVKGLRRGIKQLQHVSVHTRSFSAPEDRLYQQLLLTKERSQWIKNVLEEPFRDLPTIPLSLHEQPDAVANPWDAIAPETTGVARPLAPGTRITQVFDEAHQGLLILGEPGAGKTTLLLELARELLHRFEQDDRLLIPVVLHLASWAQRGQSLTRWLIKELKKRYKIPPSLSQTWVVENRIVLLLDGLDEVAEARRKYCAIALNAFRREHPLIPVVVCSRMAEYSALKVRLDLEQAIAVKPLTQDLVDEYLTQAGKQLATIRTALSVEPTLQELVTTPLMLSIIAKAYRGRSADNLLQGGSLEELRLQAFTTYVKSMLKRRVKQTYYTPHKTVHYLMWMAKQMKQQGQAEFTLEEIQPYSLPTLRGYVFYLIGTVLLMSLAVGLSCGLISQLAFPSLRSSPPKNLDPFFSLIFGLTQIFSKLVHTRLIGLIVAFSSGFLGAIILFASPMVCDVIIRYVIIRLRKGRRLRESVNQPDEDGKDQSIEAAIRSLEQEKWSIELLTWSWKRVFSGAITRLIRFVLLGWVLLPLGLLISFLIYWSIDLVLAHRGVHGSMSSLGNVWSLSLNLLSPNFQLVGLSGGFIIGILATLHNGLSWQRSDGLTTPTQRMWHSIRLGLFVEFTLVVLVIGVIWASGRFLGPLQIGAFFALFSWLSYIIGYYAYKNYVWSYMRYALLRLTLWFTAITPFDLVRFLDYASEHILLYKIGKRYVFIHNLLLDYFASQDVSSIFDEE